MLIAISRTGSVSCSLCDRHRSTIGFVHCGFKGGRIQDEAPLCPGGIDQFHRGFKKCLGLFAMFIEVHPPLEEHIGESAALFDTAMELINDAWAQRRFDLDAHALNSALNKPDGIPVPIAQAPGH